MDVKWAHKYNDHDALFARALARAEGRAGVLASLTLYMIECLNLWEQAERRV